MRQLTLWNEPAPVVHHLIECHYVGGRRRILCTANPDDWREPEPDNIYAGFIDQPVAYRATGRCMICDAKEARR